jgi:hypothetical protein
VKRQRKKQLLIRQSKYSTDSRAEWSTTIFVGLPNEMTFTLTTLSSSSIAVEALERVNKTRTVCLS